MPRPFDPTLTDKSRIINSVKWDDVQDQENGSITVTYANGDIEILHGAEDSTHIQEVLEAQQKAASARH